MDTKKQTIKPELTSGVRDYLPREMLLKQRVFDIIRRVYERHGFAPLETPAIEKLDVLTGGDLNFDMHLFRAFVTRGANDLIKGEESEADLALRFDLTVPLARVISSYPDLPKPFKRYQEGKVWRGERAQAGRYREFSQFDADIIGTKSMLADTDIIAIMYEVMHSLGVGDFVIKINNRKILNGLAVCANFAQPESKMEAVLRILDKLGKITQSEMLEELAKKPENQYDESVPNLSRVDIEKIKDFIDIQGGSAEILGKARELIGQSSIGELGIVELEEIAQNLEYIGIPEENWKIDFSIARGLGYYTGPIFETILRNMPELGSVFSGGRFDGLTNRFIADSNVPGVGASVGVDRLLVAIEKMNLFKKSSTVSEVLITFFDKELKGEYLTLAKTLREEGINTEIYFDKDPLKAQLVYAAKQEIPYVIIIGSNEATLGQATIRDMQTRKQKTLDKKFIAGIIKNRQPLD